MKLAVVMDPIERIKPEKDGTLDLLLSAQSFGYELTRFTLKNSESAMENLWALDAQSAYSMISIVGLTMAAKMNFASMILM